MNSLSLIIYGISVLSSLGIYLVLIITACITALVINSIVFAYGASEYKTEVKQFARKMYKWLIPTLLVCGLLQVFIPSEKFLIMIAASEVGEMAMKQPQLQGAMSNVGDLSGDATNLLKLYIANETKNITDAINKKKDN